MRAAMGMRTRTSQAWATMRDRPRPSEPMTRASGAVASSSSRTGGVAGRVQAGHEDADVAVGGQRAGQVGGAGHRHPGQRARGRLPGARRDAGAAAGRDDYPVGAERGRRASPRPGCAGRRRRPGRRSREPPPARGSSACRRSHPGPSACPSHPSAQLLPMIGLALAYHGTNVSALFLVIRARYVRP